MAYDWSRLNASSLDRFGESVTYQRAASGSPFSVSGIRKDPRQLEGFNPGIVAILWVSSADFSPSPVAGDIVTIGGAAFYVVQVAEDGGGGLELALNRKQ